MATIIKPILDPRKAYLQIALNSTLDEARKIIAQLPRSERIIIEAGTPLIKQYGEMGIAQIHTWYKDHLAGSNILLGTQERAPSPFALWEKTFSTHSGSTPSQVITPYIVADLKTMDRAETEVAMAARAGARAAIALGLAPIETLNTFVDACVYHGMDAMVDMMNVEYPLAILQKLKKIPPIIIIHRGVDEEKLNKEKQIPLYEIRRIKGMYDVMISIAGGDSVREVQRAVFNDSDIVVIWKSVYTSSDKTVELVREFLTEIK
jgi:bifunctional enzyme Fae/Hps